MCVERLGGSFRLKALRGSTARTPDFSRHEIIRKETSALKIAVLDDYQNILGNLVDWSRIQQSSVQIFTDHLAD